MKMTLKVGGQIYDKSEKTYGRVTKVESDTVTYIDRNGNINTATKENAVSSMVDSGNMQEVIENLIGVGAVRLAVNGKGALMNKGMLEFFLEDALYSLFLKPSGWMSMFELFTVDAVSTDDVFSSSDALDALNRVLSTDVILDSVVRLVMGQGVFSKSRIKEILERVTGYYLANIYNRKFQNIESQNYMPV